MANQIKLSRNQKIYLSIYNIIVTAFHFVALVDILHENFKKKSFNYSNHHQFLVITTALQYGDVIHSYFGLTKTKIPVAILQITGRIFILTLSKLTISFWSLPILYLLPSIYLTVELIRYPFYLLKIWNYDSHLITFLRYNAWIILYPIGFSFEAIIIGTVIQQNYQTQNYIYKSPFGLNFNIDFVLVVGTIIFLAFPYIALTLLQHQWAQRKAQHKLWARKIR